MRCAVSGEQTVFRPLTKYETVVVEIRDNGPLFESALSVGGRSLIVRAAKGFRPLVVWDTARDKRSATAFISVRDGNLTLEDIDVVLKGPEEANGPPALLWNHAGIFLIALLLLTTEWLLRKRQNLL